MKKILQIVSLLALTVLLGLTLSACSESGPPTIKTLEFARDYKDGSAVGVTTTFSPTEKVIYAVATLGGKTAGVSVKLVWIQAETAGVKDAKITEVTVTLAEGQNVASSNFTPTSPLPVGKYRVEVFLNDVKTQSGEFTVA